MHARAFDTERPNVSREISHATHPKGRDTSCQILGPYLRPLGSVSHVFLLVVSDAPFEESGVSVFPNFCDHLYVGVPGNSSQILHGDQTR